MRKGEKYMGKKIEILVDVFKNAETMLKVVDKVANTLSDIVEMLELDENKVDKETIFQFDSCIEFYKRYKKEMPIATGFILSVKENLQSKNENEKYVIIQGLVDDQDKPIKQDDENAIGRKIYAANIDEKSVKYLDGDDTKIFIVDERGRC